MAGHFKLQRKFFKHWLWQEERTYSRAEAWIDLLRIASYDPSKQLVNDELVDVPIGGVVASERYLSERWNWSRTKVRQFLLLLESDSMISRQKNHKSTTLILCNYKTYANPHREKRPQENRRETTEEPQKNQSKEHKEQQERECVSPPARAKVDLYQQVILEITKLDCELEIKTELLKWADRLNRAGCDHRNVPFIDPVANKAAIKQLFDQGWSTQGMLESIVNATIGCKTKFWPPDSMSGAGKNSKQKSKADQQLDDEIDAILNDAKRKAAAAHGN